MAKPKRNENTTSIRLSNELSNELVHWSSAGVPRSELINRFALEGLRMDRHPGIVFRDGPAGRRAGLVNGPDVWEVARLLREIEPRGTKAVTATAEATGLDEFQVKTALDYYASYRDEIDTWIDAVDRQAEWMEQAWRQRMDVLA